MYIDLAALAKVFFVVFYCVPMAIGLGALLLLAISAPFYYGGQLFRYLSRRSQTDVIA